VIDLDEAKLLSQVLQGGGVRHVGVRRESSFEEGTDSESISEEMCACLRLFACHDIYLICLDLFHTCIYLF
jgi:hypothetical protein